VHWQVTTPTDAAHSSSSSSSDSSQPPLKRFKLLAADTYNRATASSTHQTTDESELLAYCSDANAYTQPAGSEFYWIQHQAKFPLLAPLAQDLLSAPASQAYVERVFAVCGDLTARKRNRLTKKLEMRLFLKVNRKYYA